jgi:monovalent cation:H+ antiporter-2, CPA2 family
VEHEHARKPLAGHVVIVGYGVAGKLTAKALADSGVQFVALELNAETVRAARALGQPIYYGDATSTEALGHAHVESARALVLLMNDPQAANRVVETARRVAPQVPILMRTRYWSERDRLVSMGAKDVVVEEVEGAVEITARLLRWLEMPRNLIDQRIHEAREGTQSTERTLTIPRASLGAQHALSELKIESVLITAECAAVNRSAVELAVRRKTGALIVAVRRADRLLENPDPNDVFVVGDVVYLVGALESVRAALLLLTERAEPLELGAQKLEA